MTHFDTVTIPIATKLKVFRAILDLRQDDVSKEAQLDPAAISRFEDGLIPSGNSRAKLEGFFGSGVFDDPQVTSAISVIYKRLTGERIAA